MESPAVRDPLRPACAPAQAERSPLTIKNYRSDLRTDVKIEGQPLKAGSYALFMIPTASEWTVIFNKTAKQWGAFNYKEADDALRIKVTPQAAEPQEALQYSFPTATNDATQLVLHWEKVKVAFTISADTEAMTKAKARKVFNSTEAWWAANYYYRAKTDLEEGCAGSMLCWR